MTRSFSPTLLQALGEVLADQRARLTDPVIHTHDAVFVFGSMDAEYYLVLDGRVLWLDDETPLTETLDPYLIHATLLKAAERFDLPELRAFVPQKPANGVACQLCQGTGRIRQTVFCPKCAATGWVEAPQ